MIPNVSILLEIAVDSLSDAVAAERGGADRIELCSALDRDGLSPSMELFTAVRAAVRIPVHTMVRVHHRDFCATPDEFAVMQQQIAHFVRGGADGIVLGLLTAERSIDAQRVQELVRSAHPLPVTFHRAFDAAVDPFTALEEVIRTGAGRLLTSGQQQNAAEGLPLLRELVRIAGERISILPGAGIDAGNVERIVRECGALEVHVSRGVKVRDHNEPWRVDETAVRRLAAHLKTL